MNKKEELLDKIADETIDNILEWDVSSGIGISGVSLNPSKIIRAFTTLYKGTTVYLVEQKYPDYIGDLDEFFDRLRIDVYFIKDSVLQLVINFEEIAERIMDKLYQSVLSQCNDSFIDSILEEE